MTIARSAERLVESKPFRAFILVVILLAGVLAGLETSATLRARYGAPLRTLDAIVIGIFVVEIALKLVARGRRPLEFFRDGWNVFDFLVVALCLLPVGGPFAAVLRLARVLRLLRLFTALPKLQLLVGGLLKSLSSMGYVSLLLALLFYIYAVAGVHWFGQADEADFRTLPAALVTLCRVVTLDDWGDIFNRVIEHAPPFKVAVYFISFILFGTMIILNLFIGIILNSMSEMHAEIEARDRARHVAERGAATVEDELRLLERQARELQEQLAALRRRCAHPVPPRSSGDTRPNSGV
jgi:voltage-gated sodium channel